jgi:hypothetical protein
MMIFSPNLLSLKLHRKSIISNNAFFTMIRTTSSSCKHVLRTTTQIRQYAKGKQVDTEVSREGMAEAMKDYLRKTKFPHLNTKKSAQDFKKDEMLANQYSFTWLIKKDKFKKLMRQKEQLRLKALNALPVELRKEAMKNDYTQWPTLLQPVEYLLPPQEGFRLPEEPARNEL